MRRRSRFLHTWALIAAFVLAFSQVALAAYTCPMGAVEMAQAMPAMEMAAENCHEMAAASLPMCVKSCQDEPQKNDTPSLTALPPSPDSGLRVDLPCSERLERSVVVDAALERATSPPPTLLFARFLK
jgi:hypothetical protein